MQQFRTIDKRLLMRGVAALAVALLLALAGGILLTQAENRLAPVLNQNAETVAKIIQTRTLRESRESSRGAIDWHSVQYLDYQFRINGQTWYGTVASQALPPGAIEHEDRIAIRYNPHDPSINSAVGATTARHGVSAVLANSVATLPFALLLLLALHLLFNWIRVQRAEAKIADSDERANAWIRPQQRMVIYFDKKSLHYFRYRKEEKARVIQAWRDGMRADLIAQAAERGGLVSLRLSNIDKISCRSDKRSIDVICNQQPHRLHFNDMASRDAAMRRFAHHLSDAMQQRVLRRSRWRSARRTVLAFAFGLAAATWFSQPLGWWLLMAITLLLLLPRLLQRVIRPTEVRIMKRTHWLARPETAIA